MVFISLVHSCASFFVPMNMYGATLQRTKRVHVCAYILNQWMYIWKYPCPALFRSLAYSLSFDCGSVSVHACGCICMCVVCVCIYRILNSEAKVNELHTHSLYALHHTSTKRRYIYPKNIVILCVHCLYIRWRCMIPIFMAFFLSLSFCLMSRIGLGLAWLGFGFWISKCIFVEWFFFTTVVSLSQAQIVSAFFSLENHKITKSDWYMV